MKFTDSALRDYITNEILENTPITTMSQNIHIHLHTPFHKEMIEQLHLELYPSMQQSADNAIVKHFTHLKAHKIQDANVEPEYRLVQATTKLAARNYLNNIPPNQITLTIEPELFPKLSLSKLTSKHVDKIIQTTATVIGPSPKTAYIDKVVTSDGLMDYSMYNPKTNGKILEFRYNDSQMILIEEIGPKKELRKLTVKTYGALVGRFETGDKILITGRYSTVPDDDNDDKLLFIDAITIEKLEQKKAYVLSKPELERFQELAKNPEEYLQSLTSSFATHISENHFPKLGILLSSIIDPKRNDPRSNLFLLLIGVAGTGKSQMIKCVPEIHPNAAYLDSQSTSDKGLFYGQEELNKTKVLRAGPMVLNNLVALDEFDKLPKERRLYMNTQIEQQIADYNLVPFQRHTPINLGVIVAANPKNDKWLADRSTMENLGMEPTVIDRFLIIKVDTVDNDDLKYDRMLDNSAGVKKDTQFTHEQLQGLLSHCATLNPKYTESARSLIKSFFTSFKHIQQSEHADMTIQSRKEYDLIRIIRKMAQLLMKDIDDQCVRLGISFYKKCMESIGMATDAPTAELQHTMEGNRDDFVLSLMRMLVKEKKEPDVSESELKLEMQKSERWRTIEEIDHHIEKMKVHLLYQPRAGRLGKL